MIASWESHKTELVVDYEHNSLNPFVERSPAAGWVEGIELREDGVYALVRWTENARSLIEGREYRYISPVILLDEDTSEAIALHSVALVNTPAIDGMQPLAASSTASNGEAAPQNWTYTASELPAAKDCLRIPASRRPICCSSLYARTTIEQRGRVSPIIISLIP